MCMYFTWSLSVTLQRVYHLHTTLIHNVLLYISTHSYFCKLKKSITVRVHRRKLHGVRKKHLLYHFYDG